MMNQRSVGSKDKTSTATVEASNKRYRRIDGSAATHFQYELASQTASARAMELNRLNMVLSNQVSNGVNNMFSARSLSMIHANERFAGSAVNAFHPVSVSSTPAPMGYGSFGIARVPHPSMARMMTNSMMRGRNSSMNASVGSLGSFSLRLAEQDSSPTRVLFEAIEAASRLPILREQSQMTRFTPTRPMMESPMPSFTNTASLVASPPVYQLPFRLSAPTDTQCLSQFQVVLRMHMEAFAATPEDTTSHTRGRNKSIRVHQVGLRCRHCAHVPAGQRTRGSMYFPASILGIYQAAQNMSSMHLQCGACPEMPETTRTMFAELLATKTPGSSSSSGRAYWGRLVQEMGDLVDTDLGIFARHSIPPGARQLTSAEQTHYQST